ncbi:MAG: tRNA (adenosine(37)-N6)-threonylcarbamoyltransferase complex dimerization subunit type 1 TsaB [Chloroflexi bacterium]|nr:tRNA (adenosine(37)-N6)-threonylcarbamoyltransferase complex dimerization subunit type 1 TsaB [Chloroflexota bacterium]
MELSIEAASDDPGIALSVDGVVGLSATWHTDRNHSVELLPNIDRLLNEAARAKDDVSAVFVDVGPGGYAALRVGVSLAKGIAHGLGVPIVGIGRLEADAWLVARDAGERRIVAVHRAGRGEAAWAAYRASADGAWRETHAPRIEKRETLVAALTSGDVFTGDLDDDLLAAARSAGAAVATPHEHRVTAIATLGARRLAAAATDDATTLVPLYLRAPAITRAAHP